MKFSGLIYPAPSPPSYNTDKLVGELLFVPKDFREDPKKYIRKYATFSKYAGRLSQTQSFTSGTTLQ